MAAEEGIAVVCRLLGYVLYRQACLGRVAQRIERRLQAHDADLGKDAALRLEQRVKRRPTNALAIGNGFRRPHRVVQVFGDVSLDARRYRKQGRDRLAPSGASDPIQTGGYQADGTLAPPLDLPIRALP